MISNSTTTSFISGLFLGSVSQHRCINRANDVRQFTGNVNS
ncbi:hypothetical protein HanXRQr2_Chr15g0690471 [Helianthus annuus]|uniref:Uncharacterized protein n=1 Tax=Helianthus annuus TaxID=4232 RepID=A0A9K3E1J5_HELAN|nr:hypothetical protein HanXRQr2_Chr15g0690471 [Helianthus annuus]KAJ0831031.1 hypothetical protein HanPSC8_Chr15g0662331 [Helianthus annuus]